MNIRNWIFSMIVFSLLCLFVQTSYSYIPSQQARYITFTNVNADEVTFKWVNGNGQGVIVLVSETANPDVSALGQDMDIATANPSYTGASTYLTTGAKLVYQGTGTNTTVTDLTANTTYYFMVLAYNTNANSKWDINNGNAALNPRSKTTLQQLLTPPAGLATFAITGTTASVNWTQDGAMAAGYYIDVRLANGAVLPDYDLLDIGLPTAKTFYIYGLTASTDYEWRLRPYDEQGRVGAATEWQPFTTMTVDPFPDIYTEFGEATGCGNVGTFIASWATSGYSFAPAEGTWSVVDGPFGFGYDLMEYTAAGSNTGVFTVDLPGTYVIQHALTVGEYFASNNTFMYEFVQPSLDDVDLSSSYLCGEMTFDIAAGTFAPLCGDGFWTADPALGVSFDNANSYTTTGYVPNYGSYRFTWTLGSGDFIVSTYMDLVFAPVATAAMNINTFEVCQMFLGYLDAVNPPAGVGTWFAEAGPGTPTFLNNLSNTSSVSVDIEGEYTFKWVVGTDCSTDAAYAMATFYHPIEKPFAGDDADFCGFAGNSFQATIPEYGIGSWSLLLADPDNAPIPTFLDPTHANSELSFAPGVNEYQKVRYEFVWTVDNGVCLAQKDTVEITFWHEALSQVITPTAYSCELSFANLGAMQPNVWETATWSLGGQPLGAEATFSDVNAYNSDVLVTMPGEYTFNWVVQNGPCTYLDDKTVTFYDANFLADAGADQAICYIFDSPSFELSGNTFAIGSGSWTVTPTYLGTFLDPTLANTTFEFNLETIPVEYTDELINNGHALGTFVWTVDQGDCASTSDYAVNTFYMPIDPFDVNPGESQLVCGSFQTNMAAVETLTYATGTWSMVDGPSIASFANETSATSLVDVSEFGEYTFRWTLGNGACDPQYNDVVYTFQEVIFPNAGADFAVCGPLTQLNATPTMGGTWSVVSEDALFIDSVQINPSSSTNYNTKVASFIFIYEMAEPYLTSTFRYSVDNGDCGIYTDDVEVTFYNNPSDAIAMDDMDYCGTYGFIWAEEPAIGQGNWTLVSGPGTVTFGDATSAETDFDVSAYGEYTFRWDVQNGTCTGQWELSLNEEVYPYFDVTYSPNYDDLVVTMYEPMIANAGPDAGVCGTVFELAADTITRGTGTWFAHDGNPGMATFTNPTSNKTTVTIPEGSYGEFTFNWIVEAAPCSTQVDDITVTFSEPFTVDAGTNTAVCSVQPYTLEGTTPTFGTPTGYWSVASTPVNGTATFTDVNNPTTDVNFTKAGLYNLVWHVENGYCFDTDTVTIDAVDPVIIPTDAFISGDTLPVAGKTGVEYSIPNYSDYLSYEWVYTPSCANSGVTINNNTQNVVTLDYSLEACDGTLSVIVHDLCGNQTMISKVIDVQHYPVYTNWTLDQTNTYVDITFSAGLYTTQLGGAIVPSDFQLVFQKNTGTATNATITTVTNTSGGALVGGETTIRFNIDVAGVANGCETIEIKPMANQVYALGSQAMPITQTTGALSLYNETTPASTATGLSATEVYARQAKLNWNSGTYKSLVVVSTTNSFTAPTNYTHYNFNSDFSVLGTGLGSGKVVFNGTGTNVNVTNLTSNTLYYYAVYNYSEACGTSNEVYSLATVGQFTTGKEATQLTVTTVPTITSGTPFNFTVNALAADSTPGYTICNDTLTVTVSSGTLSGTVKVNLPINTTSATFTGTILNLPNGGCDIVFTIDDHACGNDLTPATFTVPHFSATEPSLNAKGLILSNIKNDRITVSWTNGDGTGRMLVVRKDSAIVPTVLVDGTNYTNVPTTSPVNFTTEGYSLGSNFKIMANMNGPVEVQGLTSNTLYNFRVFEYNNNSCDPLGTANYKNGGSFFLNPRAIRTLAKSNSFSGVEIVNFDGKSNNYKVELSWDAIREEGVSYYDVYRLDANGEEIKVGTSNIKTTAGRTNSYTMIDNNNVNFGDSYLYTLVAYGFDGEPLAYEETIVTINDLTNLSTSLTIGTINPNPVKDLLRFDVNTTQSKEVVIEIRSLEGKVIYSELRNINGSSTVEFRMNNKAAGTYFITVTSGDEASVTSFVYQP